MDSILHFLLSNALVATVLAFVLVLVGALWRHPRLLHMLWVIVLVKLVTPPIVTVPIPLVLETAAETQAFSPYPTRVDSAPPDEMPAFGHEEIAYADAPTDGEFATDAAPSAAPSATSQLAGSFDAMVTHIRAVSWRAWLALLWLGGSVICLAVTVSRVVAFRRLLRKSRPAEKPVLQQVHRLSCLLGLKTRPRIVMLPGRISPVVWHMSRRVTIVLPEQLFGRLDDESQQTVLAHELAHVARRDHWVRLLEVFATLLFWWQPVLWWARRRLHELEEQCCDIEVLRVLPNSARSYANALVDTVEFMRESHVLLPATAIGVRPTSLLKRRIEMVVRAESVARFSLLHAALVGLVALTALPLALVGQSDDLHADLEVQDATVPQADGNSDGRLLSVKFSTYGDSERGTGRRIARILDQGPNLALDLTNLSTVPMAAGTQDSGELPEPILMLVDQTVLAVDRFFDDWNTRPDVEINVREFLQAFVSAIGAPTANSISYEADQNGDRHVSRDEARRFIEIQFGMRRSDGKLLREPNGRVCNLMLYEHIDLNKNDRLERDEFEQRSYFNEKAASVFEKGDGNGDDAISFDEWGGLPNRNFINPVNDFRKMDTNQDGRVGPEELAVGTPEWKKKMAANVFPGFDTDKDGMLSLAEYRLTMQANPVVRWQQVIEDPDGDGALSFAEFQFGTSQFPLLRWICFQRLDVNRSDRLEPDEFSFKVKMPDQFFVMNEDGTGWRPLFQLEEYYACGSPAVSPDGKLIAFDGWKVNPRTYPEMFVMNIDGTNLRRLHKGMMPNWSKDGTMLAYSGSGTRIINTDGREHKVIARAGWGAQWSPDGKMIAFTESNAIKTYDVQTEAVRTVLASDAHEYSRFYWNMTWSPDSQRLCFNATKADGSHEVATVHTTRDEPRLKVHHSTTMNVNADFAWHPNGDRIVFAMLCQERDCTQLYEFNPNKDDPPKLVDGQDETGNHTDVCWTPDGRQLIVVTGNF